MENKTYTNGKEEKKMQIWDTGFEFCFGEVGCGEKVEFTAEDRRALGMKIINWMTENKMREI